MLSVPIREDITPGLAKAISRNGARMICKCGMVAPTYVGRYPKRCPLCGEPWVPVPQPTTDAGSRPDSIPATGATP